MTEQRPYLRTLGNGITVLEALKDGPLTIQELVDATGIARLTVYRILRTLEFHRLVAKDPASSQFRLALKLWEFSHASLAEGQRGPIITAQAEALRDRWGETVHVAVYEQGEVVYIKKLDGTMPLRSYTVLGGRAPARCVATGKALLAFQRPDEIERVAAGPLSAFSPRTITSAAELRSELEAIRGSLTAVNRGEWRAEIGGVASPILSPSGDPVTAIGLSGPVDRIQDEDGPARGEHVRRAAATIAASLAPQDAVDEVWRVYSLDPTGAPTA